jgi:hypothetical protein
VTINPHDGLFNHNEEEEGGASPAVQQSASPGKKEPRVRDLPHPRNPVMTRGADSEVRGRGWEPDSEVRGRG